MIRFLVLTFCAVPVLPVLSDEKVETPRPGNSASLEFTKWSGDINVPDPVAISFDNEGRAYVTQTQRRKVQDLDIRQHRDWIPNDVGLQSVQDKLAFYHRVLAVGNDTDNAKLIEDINGDGHHDFRDLMVISEKIHLLQDVNGDGVADSMSTFAEGFRTEVTGIAAGVLHHDGSVYATIAPDVWRLRDTNDDGMADQRDVIATGFGLHIAYGGHDMHGLTVGPDGKIYWSIGDKGISTTSKDGRRFHYPNQGGVMRCNPDGSEFEVFAHGLRNVQELAFDQYGNLFGVDNDADKPGERERFVYIVKGMDAGWRCNYQYRGSDYDPWMAEKLSVPWHEGQPAYILPPISQSIDGPAGFAFNPGTALSPDYKNYFFLTGAPGGTQIAFQVATNGASFTMVNEHTIGRGVPIVGINFGPDGGLYGVDWGGGYPLNQTGAVWKIDDPKYASSEARTEVRHLLAEGIDERETESLLQLLTHADQRIRLGAQFELVNRNALHELTAVASRRHNLPARVHAVWGLGQLARQTGAAKSARSALVDLLADDDSELLTQVIRTIGDLKTFEGRLLIPLLAHSHARVQFAAASSLGDHPTSGAFDGLVSMADELQASNTYLRFALMKALTSCATDSQLAALKNHENRILQLAAVVALRRQASPVVVDFLSDTTQLVATEAARAIHDDFSIPDALAKLAESLATTPHGNNTFVLRAINANFRIGQANEAKRLADYAARPDVTRELRLAAINALADWPAPPELDRVTGRFRDLSAADRSHNREQLMPKISDLIRDEDPLVSAAALATAVNLKITVDADALTTLVRSTGAESDIRVQALNVLDAQKSDGLEKVIDESLESDDVALRIRALELLARRDLGATVPRIAVILSQSKIVPERQTAAALLGDVGTTSADALINVYLSMLADNKAAEIRLEIMEAAAKRAGQNHQIAQTVEAYTRASAANAESDPTARFDECFVGGDDRRGRELFRTHIAAQCIRCHRIGKTGSDVGPKLDDVAIRRDAKYLLRSIVAPSADIEQKYRTQSVVLSSGKVVQGVLLKKDDSSMTLADAQGQEIFINLDDVDETFEQKISIMPEMTKALSRREIRDLLAYLLTLKKK